MPSQLGGGKHELLELLLHPEKYKRLATHDFTAPNNPGTSPNIPVEATWPQINEIVRDHKTKLREWQETSRTDQALQQQLITAFDEQYLRGLRNIHTGYVSVVTFQMLMHLYDNYGIITAVDIENNDKEIRTPYNPALPIETLFH